MKHPDDSEAAVLADELQYKIWEESPKEYIEPTPPEVLGHFYPTNPAWDLMVRVLRHLRGKEVGPRSAAVERLLSEPEEGEFDDDGYKARMEDSGLL